MLAYGVDVITVIQIAALLVSAALLLTQKKPKVANLDDALQSVATQGAFIPLIIGRQRVGPVFAWVEDATAGVAALTPLTRNLIPSLSAGIGTQGSFGKGGGGVPNPPSYFENALHLLCVGPASELRAIYQNGEIIWQGPITPDTHPSGSTLSAGSEGDFQVHWGFTDDPILTELQNSKTHGLPVRYTRVMKILWKSKNLGQSRQWPRLEYEVKCPCYSQLTTTASEVPLTGTDNKPTFRDRIQPDSTADLVAVNQGAPDGTRPAEFWIGTSTPTGLDAGPTTLGVLAPRSVVIREKNTNNSQRDLTSFYPAGGIVKFWTSNNSNGTAWFLPNNNQWKYYWVIQSYYRIGSTGQFRATILVLGPEVDPDFLKNQDSSNPYVTTNDVSGSQLDFRTGQSRPVDTINTDGVNPIHMIDQILFAKYPYGCGKDRSMFDARSIEVAAEIIQKEKIRGALSVKDGEGGKSALAAILQDLGLFIPWDVQVGKFVFNLVRYEESTTDVPAEMILEDPEIISVQGIRPADVLAFTFKDRERNYREVPVRVIDAGQVEEYQTQRSRKIPIEVTNDRDSINRIAPRRQQEALANLSATQFSMNHIASLACPGQRFTAASTTGDGMQFIITDVQRDINTSMVTLGTVLDCYNPPILIEPPFSARTLTEPDRTPAEQLANFEVFELPRALSSGEIEMLFLASRKTEQTVSAMVWGSRDGEQFSVLGTSPLVISGRLIEEIPADAPYYDEGTYAVDFLDCIDANSVLDLSLDEDSWRAGKQIMILGTELIYLQTGGPGSPDFITGLIRGRAGTLKQAHPIGTGFWILPASYVITLKSTLFVAGKPLQYKTQAVTKNKQSDLADIEPVNIDVEGRAFTPPPVQAIRQSNLSTSYPVGTANINLAWSYFSDEFKKTGFGEQPLGAPCGTSPVRGYFLVSTPTKTYQTSTNSIAIPVADRGALDVLPSWAVTVVHVEGSFSSDPQTLTLTPQ